MIDKGFISSIDEGSKTAVVIPLSGSVVTHDLVIPYFLRECLEINMPVAYASFEDNTGVIIARMDGEWNHTIYDNVHIKGDVKTDGVTETVGDVTAGGVSLRSHTHGYTHGGLSSGSDTTTAAR